MGPTDALDGALPDAPSPDAFRSDPRSLLADERAIEGLPIRLVIALVVGVASLSVMMSMVTGIGGLGASELDARSDPDTVDLSHDATVEELTVTVVDDSGAPVEGATVILQGESARLQGGARHADSAADGTVTFEDVSPTLGPNQQQGTLAIDLQPPGGDYQDERSNGEILVLDP